MSSLRKELRIRKSTPCRLFTDQWPLIAATRHKYAFTGHHNWQVARSLGRVQGQKHNVPKEKDGIKNTEASEEMKIIKLKSSKNNDEDKKPKKTNVVASWKSKTTGICQGQIWIENGKGDWKRRFQLSTNDNKIKIVSHSTQLDQEDDKTLEKPVNQRMKLVGQEDIPSLSLGSNFSSPSNMECDNDKNRLSYQSYIPFKRTSNSSSLSTSLDLDDEPNDNSTLSSSCSELDDLFSSVTPSRPLSRSGPSWVSHYKCLNERKFNMHSNDNEEDLMRSLVTNGNRHGQYICNPFNHHTAFCGHIRRPFYSKASSKNLMTYSRSSFVRSQLYKQKQPCNCSKIHNLSWYIPAF